jgi:hypothetical protein
MFYLLCRVPKGSVFSYGTGTILAGTGKSTKGIFAFVFFRLLCSTDEKEKKENVIGNKSP